MSYYRDEGYTMFLQGNMLHVYVHVWCGNTLGSYMYA